MKVRFNTHTNKESKKIKMKELLAYVVELSEATLLSFSEMTTVLYLFGEILILVKTSLWNKTNAT